ncbi:MAG: 50S ribosomal protein L4 [Candidatus Hydrogenedentota bacterium]|nr:MAG: 50S ribosomal protein L4 [Candidatus Hydrogenedentota bacterium]
MAVVPVMTLEGVRASEIAVPDGMFAARVARHIIHDVLRAEEAARRQGNAKVKTRGEVRGGGAKPHRQKGTGRARQGSIRSPLWVGGGTVFGPRPRSYRQKRNRKERRAALAGALSARLSEERLVGLRAEGLEAPKTSAVARFLDSLPEPVRKPMLVHSDGDDVLVKSFRNISGARTARWESVSVRGVMVSDFVLFSEEALKQFAARYSKTASGEEGEE